MSTQNKSVCAMNLIEISITKNTTAKKIITALPKALLSSALILGSVEAYAAKEKNTKGLLPEVRLNSQNEDENNETAFKSEVLITKSENKAIESLKKIIEKKKGSPEAADLQFRLAELYMRRAKSGRFFDLNEKADKKLGQLGLQNQKALDSLKAAIVIYNEIENQHPKYKAMDEVLFNNALAHTQIKQLEKAKELYNKLTAQYPKSALIPDALLEVGELYYNQQNFTVALEKFKAIEKFKNSKAYPYGLYKSAWCHYNLKDTDEGVKQLTQVVKLNPADSQDEKKYNLRREALRDLTLFVGETTPPEQLYSFFSNLTTTEELGEVILNLASLYESHSRFKEISIFANEFISKNPFSSSTAKIYTKLIDSEETLKNRPQVIVKMKQFGDYCTSYTSLEQQTECKTEFRKVSLEISKKWWDIWLKNKKHTEFSKLTEQAFEILLSQEDLNKPDTLSRFAYAELLFQLEKFSEAQKNYEIVSEVKNLDKTKAHDALYGALFSIEKQLEKIEKDKDSLNQEILTAQQKKLAERYLKEFANGEHVESLTFKLGYIAYQQKNYDESLKILMPFSQKNYAKSFKIKAEDIILDIYNVKKDFKQLMVLTTQIKKATTDEARSKLMTQINEEAHYSQIQKDSENKDPLQKIDLLKQFSLAHKESKLGQESLWQAVSLAYANQFDILGANLSQTYVEQYPKDSKNLDAIKEATKAFIEAGHLEKAISSTRFLARLEPQNSLAHLEMSCDLLLVNSQLPEARGCYKGLFEKAERSKKTELLTKIYKTYDEKNKAELAGIENQIIEQNIEPFATQILIHRARKLVENKKFSEAWALSLKLNSRPVSADVRAEARLVQAEILEKEFFAQSVRSRESKFALVLALKTEKFDKAYTAYTSTIKMSKSNYIQALALQGIDRLYAHYIESLATMPVPASLSAVEKQALKDELVKMTVPFQEKQKENLVKLRQVSKLSANENQEINWADFSLEKTVEPRLVFPHVDKLQAFLPQSYKAFQTDVKRLPATEKKCETQALSSIGSCIQAKNWSISEKLALQMTETKDTRPLGLYYLSVVAEAQNEKEKALWAIEKALKLEDTSGMFNYQKAKVLYNVEGLNSALPYFEKALDIKKQSYEISLMAALKSFSDKDFLSASEEFSQIPSEVLYHFNVAVLYVEAVLLKGETEQASQLAQRLVNAQPKNVDMVIEQARIFEEFSLKKEEAVSAYQKALTLSQKPEQKDWLKRKIEFLKTNKNNQITSNVGG